MKEANRGLATIRASTWRDSAELFCCLARCKAVMCTYLTLLKSLDGGQIISVDGSAGSSGVKNSLEDKKEEI